MNTPAHLIFGLTAFGKVGAKRVTAGALAGAIIPDLSLYLLAGWELIVKGTDANHVFGTMYYSESWQAIFRVDNSFVVWGIGLSFALMLRSGWAIALCGAALLHLALDFPLHNDDARAHFWPVSNWKFVSPVSYWDGKYFGHIVGPLEIAASVACCVLLWRRFQGLWMRILIATLGAMELVPGIAFAIMFAGGSA